MTGINHAVTGAVVAIAVKQPLLALPAAFLSHFAIDMLPHWDYKVPKLLRRYILAGDLLISVWLLILLAVILPVHGWLALAGGWAAILPDTMWLPYILYGRPTPTHKKTALHRTRRLHLKIQWSETARGLAVEALWLIIMLVLLVKIA